MAITIVVIEDNPETLELIKTILSGSGNVVHTSMEGNAGLKLVRKVMPDVVVLDVMLPDVSGYHICGTLKQDPAFRNTPILILTALDKMEDQELALRYGADDFLAKPFETDRLLQKVNKLSSKK